MKNLHSATLSNADRQAIAQLAKLVQDHPQQLTHEAILQVVKTSNSSLKSIERSLQLLTTQQIDYLVLNNLPRDRNLPEPPHNGARPLAKSSWVSEVTLLLLAHVSGLEPVGYQEEKRDVLIHEISPSLGSEKILSSTGKVPLGFHTDLAILKAPYRPNYLFLYGLINEGHTPTYITLLEDVLQTIRLHHQTMETILKEPRFRVESPASFDIWGGKVIKSEPRPLIYKGLGGLDEISANLYAVSALDPEAQQALQYLMSIVPTLTKEILIAPGKALLFNNHRCLHGRPAISQGRRWLQRLYCRHSLEALHQASGANSGSNLFEISQLILE